MSVFSKILSDIINSLRPTQLGHAHYFSSVCFSLYCKVLDGTKNKANSTKIRLIISSFRLSKALNHNFLLLDGGWRGVEEEEFLSLISKATKEKSRFGS